MGVVYTHIFSDFYMPASNSENATKAIQGYIKKNPEYVWDATAIARATNIKECFYEMGFVATTDENGDIIELEFGSDKLPYDGPDTVAYIFDKIAKYVKKDSKYILMDDHYSFFEYRFYGTHANMSEYKKTEYDAVIEEAKYKTHWKTAAANSNENQIAAIKLFSLATTIKPEYSQAWLELATAYANHKEWDKAWETCLNWEKTRANPDTNGSKKETVSFPQWYNAFYQVGDIARAENNFSLAYDCYKKAAEKLHISEVYWHLAEVCFNLEQYEQSYQAAQKLLEIDPKHSYPEYYMGMSALFLKNYAVAEKDLLLATKKFKTWYYPKILLAETYFHLKSKKLNAYCQKLIASIQKHIDKKPKESYFEWSFLARLYLLLGDYPTGINCIEKAIALKSDNEYFTFIKGQIYLATKNYTEAKQMFERCLAKYPNWTIVKEHLERCEKELK